MKKQLLTSAIAGCFLAASGAAAASDHAGALEALTGIDINGTKLTKDLGIDFGGWVSAGFAWNTGDPSNGRNGPTTFQNRDLEFTMDQLNLFISEEATAGDNYDLGFRADVMFGTDAGGTQAEGLDDKLMPNISSRYDLAIPQLYAELYAPIGNGVTIKAGHFYTIIGNEAVTSPDNFFYSHAYTMQYGEPFTHTGLIAETSLADSINIRAGSVLGWEAFNSDTDQAWSFIGGADWTSVDGATSVTLASVYGDTTEDSDIERWVYSIVITHDITDSLHLLVQHDHGLIEGDGGEWYGANSYLTYDVSDNLAVAVRGEWFRDQDGTQVTQNWDTLDIAGVGESYYAVTAGVNYSITNWLKVRPEVRYDWSDNTNAFDNQSKDDQFLVSIDTVITF
jgi:hypothetical protein